MERYGCHRMCDADLAAGVKLSERAHPSVNSRKAVEARHWPRAATLHRLPRGGRAERKRPVTGLLSPTGTRPGRLRSSSSILCVRRALDGSRLRSAHFVLISAEDKRICAEGHWAQGRGRW